MVGSQFLELLYRHPVSHQEDRHIADYFAGRRDLDDIAERTIDAGISGRDLMPSLTESHAFGLFLEISELPARHLMQVDFGGTALGAGIEGCVPTAHNFPVVGAMVECV